jgi:hypothetical protein
MLKIKKEMLVRTILTSSLLFLVSCSNTIEPLETVLSFDMRLTEDSNGYYHMTVDRDNWQSLHKVSGSIVTVDGQGIENFWVEWESNLYWYLGDTLGYFVHRGLTNNLVYVSYDTTYITGFNGMEVPTSNMISYSNSAGEINNMIAPVNSMIGDTMILKATWNDFSTEFGIVLE